MDKSLTQDLVRRELEFCREKVDALLPRFQDCFPGANTEGLIYPAETENIEWTTSFFSGMLWLLYEHTGDGKYLKVLSRHLESFYERVERPGHVDLHDLGFLYSLSCYPAALLLGNERARACFLKAADYLKARYLPQAEIIQAWGNMDDPNNRGVDECTIWGDYYYMEALFRLLYGGNTYWD